MVTSEDGGSRAVTSVLAMPVIGSSRQVVGVLFARNKIQREGTKHTFPPFSGGDEVRAKTIEASS